MTHPARLLLVLCLVTSTALCGCYGDPIEPVPLPGEGGHRHDAPRGGALVEIGDDDAYLELFHDGWKGELRVYVLGSHAAGPLRMEQGTLQVEFDVPGGNQGSMTLIGLPNALTGETTQDTSVFSSTHPALEHVQRFEGSVKSMTMDGKTYTDVRFRYPEGDPE